ncbi:MAG TPA: TetR/AcrR family transcriptional regulator [Solirubrobacterales bacterium]|jgi:AcrR family transcriptional regulator
MPTAPKRAKKKEEEAKPSRLELRREARKQAILRAAGAELARAGYSRASLDDIAEHVHVTKATLYHYFANKEELYRAWMDDVSAEVSKLLDAAVGEGPARERLWRLANAEVLILTSDFPDYARLFMAGVDWPEPFQERIRELRRAHEANFRRVIDDGVAAGEFDVADETIARYCFQGALAYVPEWYRGSGRLGAEELAAAVADSAVRIFTCS